MIDEILAELLGGLPVLKFGAAFFYAVLGLLLNVFIGARMRLKATEPRQVNYKSFACRVAASLITVFAAIVLCKDIFGLNATVAMGFSFGLAVDLTYEKIATFAKSLITNQNTSNMEEQEFVFSPIHSQNDSVLDNLISGQKIPVSEYAINTGGLLQQADGEADGVMELVYMERPVMAFLTFVDVNSNTYFVGHVPRKPKINGID